MLLYGWQLWPNACSTSGGKGSSSSKEPVLIPYNSSIGLTQSQKMPWERKGDNGLILKFPGHIFPGIVSFLVFSPMNLYLFQVSFQVSNRTAPIKSLESKLSNLLKSVQLELMCASHVT
jgi:hypothetical protein